MVESTSLVELKICLDAEIMEVLKCWTCLVLDVD